MSESINSKNREVQDLNIPRLQVFGCYLGASLAGSGGAIIGSLLGAMTQSLLLDPEENLQHTLNLSEFSSGSLDALLNEMSKDDLATMRQDLLSAWRDSAREAIIDMGGKKCFLEEWKKRGKQAGKSIRRSAHRGNAHRSIQDSEEQNEIGCSYLKSILAALEQTDLFSGRESFDISLSETNQSYFYLSSYSSFGHTLFDSTILPFLQQNDSNPNYLWQFKTNSSIRFLDRLLVNLGGQLRVRFFAWQVFNRLFLEAARQDAQTNPSVKEDFQVILNSLLDAPDTALLESWSEELAALLAACASSENRMNASLVELCRQVVSQSGATRVYLYGLLGQVERTESLVERADVVFRTQLNPKQQEFTRRIFIRMTDPGDGRLDVSRRIQVSELYPSLEDAPAVEGVLKILAEAGLVRMVRHMVEPSSESLIQKWPILRQWLDEDRVGLRLLYRLSEQTHQWIRSRRSEDALLRGAQLMQLDEWLKHHPGITNPQERDFLQASHRLGEETYSQVEPQLRSEIENSRKVLDTEHQRAESYRMQAEAEHQRAEGLTTTAGKLRTFSRIMTLLLAIILVLSLLIFSSWSNMNLELSRQATQSLLQLTQAAQGAWQAGTAQAASIRAQTDRATALAENTRTAQQREAALNQAKASLSNLLAAQAQKYLAAQPDLGLLLAVEANNLMDHFGTRAALVESLQSIPRLAHILVGHSSPVKAVTFSPDGRYLASGSENGIIRIWQAGSGTPVGEPLNSQSGAIYGLSFSPDGKTLASVTGDRNVYLWSLETSQAAIIPVIDLISGTCISFSPDGKLLAVGGESRNNHAFLLDAASGRPIGLNLAGQSAQIESIVFSPDGQFVAAAGWDRSVIIWDKTTQRPILPPFKGPEDRITSLAFHPEGKLIAASSADRSIYFWIVLSGRQAYRFESAHTNLISGIAFSSDGKTLSSSSLDGNLSLWNLTTREKIMDPLKGHTGEIYAVAFHPNGVLFASAGQDQKTLVWDLRASQQLSHLSINSSDIKKAVLHPDGRLLVDLDCARYEGALCLQDEARFWLVSSNSISLLPGRQPLRDYRQMYGVQLSPDGSIAAIAGCQSEGSASVPCYQHGVRLYLTSSGKQIGVPLEGHTEAISAMAFSPDGRTLVTGSWDRTIRIWDGTSGTSTGTVVRSHTGGITALAFSPDGRRLVSAALDRTIRLWDTSTWLPASQPLRGHTDSAYSLAYQPDGRYFLSGGADRLVVQWDSSTFRQQPSILTNHTGVISNLVVSPDSSMLFSTGNDRTLRFWTIANQKEMGQPMVGHAGIVHSLSLSRDGSLLMTASRETIRIWDLNPKAWQAKACQIAGRNLTLKEWASYLPGETYRKTCSAFPEGK